MVNSGQFCGVAEMVSEVEFDKIFNYWWEDLKWSGIFKINWVFVRDLHHADVQDVRVNGTSIHLLKDGSRVDFQAGKRMLEGFQDADLDSDIFEYFEFMDEREEKLRMKRDNYLELIRQLRNRGLIPDFAKQTSSFRGGHSKFQGPRRFNGPPSKPGRGGYRGGAYNPHKDKDGKPPAYYPSRREGDSSEYVRKDEFK